MEHSHLIIDINFTHKKRKYFDWALYNNNVFDILDIYPNLTYYAKISILIDIFSNTKITRSQIMNHINLCIVKNHMNILQITKFNHHI